MSSNATKRRGGFALLAVSGVLLLASGFTDAIPIVAGGAAALGLAAGALLVGTAGEGRPV